MNIIITAREAMDNGVWDDICEIKGYNRWAIHEGLMDDTEKITITIQEAERMGLIGRDNDNCQT